ncbi:hypothetical protein [Xanthobacter autotrophicus]|uniref:hypothetical protein n=1 Tax=Xanthobacter autotrophicus TaxID=280 RepID=UPI00372B965A
MAALLHLPLLTELEYGRLLGLLKAAHHGHVPVTGALADALRKALFPIAAEFLAALAPLQRMGGGLYALDVPLDARCWPAGAEGTADTGFKPGEVRVEAMTGTWEDANGRGHGVAWGDSIAARVWRRPGAPCGSLDAVERLLAMIGAAVLLQRMADRGHDVDGAGALPFVADAPPLVPEMPEEAATTAAPAAPEVASAPLTSTTGTDEEGPLVAVPALVLDALQCIAVGLEELARHPACASVIRADGAEPDEVAHAAELAGGLAARAMAGEWGAPPAHAARPAEVVGLARARRQRGAHLRAVPAAGAVATAAKLRATACTMLDLARAAKDPVRAAEMRAAGLRPDLLAGGERFAARLEADADHIARLLAGGDTDTPPAA